MTGTSTVLAQMIVLPGNSGKRTAEAAGNGAAGADNGDALLASCDQTSIAAPATRCSSDRGQPATAEFAALFAQLGGEGGVVVAAAAADGEVLPKGQMPGPAPRAKAQKALAANDIAAGVVPAFALPGDGLRCLPVPTDTAPGTEVSGSGEATPAPAADAQGLTQPLPQVADGLASAALQGAAAAMVLPMLALAREPAAASQEAAGLPPVSAAASLFGRFLPASSAGQDASAAYRPLPTSTEARNGTSAASASWPRSDKPRGAGAAISAFTALAGALSATPDNGAGTTMLGTAGGLAPATQSAPGYDAKALPQAATRVANTAGAAELPAAASNVDLALREAALLAGGNNDATSASIMSANPASTSTPQSRPVRRAAAFQPLRAAATGASAANQTPLPQGDARQTTQPPQDASADPSIATVQTSSPATDRTAAATASEPPRDPAIMNAAQLTVVRQETHFAPVIEQSPAGQIADRVTSELAAAPARNADPAQPDTGGQTVKVLHIQLNPPELGPLTIRMTLKHETLELQVEASRHETASMIEKDRDTIYGMLRSAGYTVDGLTVQVAAPDKAATSSTLTGSGTYQQPSGQTAPGGQQQESRMPGRSWQGDGRGSETSGGNGKDGAEAGASRTVGGALYL